MVDSVIQIAEPFALFHDIDGMPLENGYIYIGEAGLDPITNPIIVYSDSDLLIPIAQPIRTLGGYPVVSGTPVKLYGPLGDYSITVLNKRGTLIYTALSSAFNNLNPGATFSDLESFRQTQFNGDTAIIEAANEGTGMGRMLLVATGTTGGTPTLTAARFSALAAGEIINSGGFGYALSVDQAITPMLFGGLGDGVTDDAVPIQLAIDYCKTLLSGPAGDGFTEHGPELVFPRGAGSLWRHTIGLNLTGIASRGFTITFKGCALLSECTGEAAVDCTNSRFITWNDLYILGSASAIPAIGLLLARNSTGANADYHVFNGYTRINGHFSMAGLYNYASEVNSWEYLQAMNYATDAASYSVVFTRKNALGATSVFQTIGTTEQSTNDNVIQYANIQKWNNGFLGYIEGVRALKFLNGYAAFSGGAFPSLRTGFWQIGTDSAERCTDLVFKMHHENVSGQTCNSIINYTLTSIQQSIFGLELSDFLPTGTGAWIRFANGIQGITGLKLTGFISAAGPLLFANDGASNPNIRQAEIRNLGVVASAGCINLSALGASGTFSGDIFTFDPSDLAATTNVTLTTANIITTSRSFRYEGRDILTIAGGILTLASNYVDIKGEGSANDDLNTIAGTFFDGEVITLVNTDATDVITLKHNAGNIWSQTGADVVLNFRSTVQLKYISNLTFWVILNL